MVSNPALPEPIALVVEDHLAKAISAEDEVGKLKAFDHKLLKYFEANEKFMDMIKILSESLGQEKDWVLEKFVKGLMFQDPMARKLLIRRDWNEKNGYERVEKYFEHYRLPEELNYVPSFIVACLFAAMYGSLNLASDYQASNELLSVILPMVEPPEEEKKKMEELRNGNFENN